MGQAVEALETVRLLAHAIEREGLEAPVTSALARLIEGATPLKDWLELVRAMQRPAGAFWRSPLVAAHARVLETRFQTRLDS